MPSRTPSLISLRWRNSATRSPEWTGSEARLSKLFVNIWSITPLKQEASSSLGTSDKGWRCHRETFPGSHSSVHVLALSSQAHILSSWSWFPPSPPTALASITTIIITSLLPGPSPIITFPLWSETEGHFPCFFLPAASWRCCCLFFFFKWRVMLDRETCLKPMQLN